MEMIPIGAASGNDETIDVGLTRLNGILSDACNPISSIGDAYAVPVNSAPRRDD